MVSPLVGLFEEMCVFPTNKTRDPPKGATYKYQVFRYRNICICFLLNITIFEGYLVLNVGKLGSYISFLVKPPTSFILYCVFPSIWGLYTVTLSPRIASPIQTKHKKIKNDTHCFTTQNQTLYMFDPNAKEVSRFAYCAQLGREREA